MNINQLKDKHGDYFGGDRACDVIDKYFDSLGWGHLDAFFEWLKLTQITCEVGRGVCRGSDRASGFWILSGIQYSVDITGNEGYIGVDTWINSVLQQNTSKYLVMTCPHQVFWSVSEPLHEPDE